MELTSGNSEGLLSDALITAVRIRQLPRESLAAISHDHCCAYPPIA